MLSELVTHNFKKIQDKEVKFGSGLNVLRGPNWSGKSTTLNAIKFALQGIQGIPGGKDDIATWDVKGKPEVCVKLGDLKIVRSVNDCNIYSKDKVLATGHTACNAYLDQEFGISVANYNMLHFSDQGETAGLLTIGAAELQKMVELIADVTVIDKVVKLAGTDATMLRGKVEGKELLPTTELKSESIILNAKVENLKLVIKDLKEKNSVSTANLIELVNTKESLKEKIRKSKQATTVVNQCKVELATAVNTITLVEDKAKVKPKDPTEYTSEINEISELILEAKSDLSTMIQDLEDYNKAEGWLTEDYEVQLKEELKWKELTAKLQKSYDEKIAETEKCREEFLVLDTQIKEIVLPESTCTACNRPFGSEEEYSEILAKVEGNIKNLKVELQVVEDRHSGLKKEVQKLFSQLQSAEKCPPESLGVEDTKETMLLIMERVEKELPTQEIIKELEKDIAESQSEVDDLRAKKQNAATLMTEYLDAKRKLDKAVEDKSNLTTKISAISEKVIDESELKIELDKVDKDAYAVQDTVTDIRNKLSNAEISMSSDLAEYNSIVEKIERFSKENESLLNNQKTLATTTELVKYLRDSRSRFLKSIWDRILGYASTFCRTCTNDEIEGVIRDQKGKFRFIENGVDRAVTCASGAQKSFMGVGVRIGLAKALYGSSSFMVLDEPSSDMSVENSTRLVSTLMGTGMQIIYSTHSDLEELSAGNVIDLGEM